MRKVLNYVWENILLIETIFLIIFIPLYPKLPLLDVKNTWVYIRVEDFLVFFVLISWLILLFKKKISFKTPLTIPIIIFWLIGSIATIHGILVIFPSVTNLHPNVAFLSLIRHIEYLSLFFIAFYSLKEKKQLNLIITTLAITLSGIIFYGFGQRFLQFPAFLTMNEEFAKGTPIQLSALSRIPSTFAGHYDLAAYLVLVVPIIFSLIFGVKNIFVKAAFLIITLLSIVLMLMTVSRVSFFVLFISFFIVLLYQKRKIILLSIPLILIFGILFLTSNSSILDRFKSTVSETQVLVDAKTGQALGNTQITERDYFENKIVIKKEAKDKDDLLERVYVNDENVEENVYYVILPNQQIPKKVALVKSINISNGEALPQGTGYVNLYLSPVINRFNSFYYELPPTFSSSPAANIMIYDGDFLVKKASAYDLSFTTRFQGEWPNAINAFKKNILIGSGYGSVSLAVDNNYLRMLAEVGLLGFISFVMFFVILVIYVRKIFPDIDSKVAKGFIVGFGAGLIGLSLNAILIDVFEASKIAFSLWLLYGVVFSLLILYQKNKIDLVTELKNAVTSVYAFVIYIIVLSWLIFSPILNNYFVADDFTWLKWVSENQSNSNILQNIIKFFTDSQGFFYRPGTKIYFLFMYKFFWLNQVVYHVVSILSHTLVAITIFGLSLKILKNKYMAVLVAILFLISSGLMESVNWISASGHIMNSLFILLSLLLFIYWKEKKNILFFLGSIIFASFSLLFHEAGVITPLLIALYVFVFTYGFSIKKTLKEKSIYLYVVPPIIYLILRYFSDSHWSGGDYSYNLLLLPFNFIGNLIGYVTLGLLGPISLSIYDILRNFGRSHILIIALSIPIIIGILFIVYKLIRKIFNSYEQKVIVFSILFIIISLLPFLGLGNLAPRYGYLATFGVIMIFVLFINKIYEYLLNSGKEIAILLISLFILIYSTFQIMQIQQTYFNWSEAGKRTKNFFIALQSLYSPNWSTNNIDFHFVNVPTKVGDAWVFPVGIKDAVWLVFRNENTDIYLHNDLQSALDQAGLYRSRPVIIFNEDGSVIEADRFKDVPIDLILP